MKILITGGAGFIGSHVTKLLLDHGHQVTVLDDLDRQVHSDLYEDGEWSGRWPAYFQDILDQHRGKTLSANYLDVEADHELLAADVSRGAYEVVIHLAAKVGVGQSASEPAEYARVNALGTARLLQALQRAPSRPRRLIVASSMSCYGEGTYLFEGDDQREKHFRRVSPRDQGAITEHGWDYDGLVPVATDEEQALMPQSIYAETKATTERMALIWGRQQGVQTIACRFFNVYGPHQSPRNPYTGIVSIFASAALRGESPRVYEDGAQTRDFVHVWDVAAAVAQLADGEHDITGPINVCTGRATRVLRVAEQVCETVRELRAAVGDDAPTSDPIVTGEFRPGDVRHCVGDATLLQLSLGWCPTIRIETGIPQTVAWIYEESRAGRLDVVGDAHADLRRDGLLTRPRDDREEGGT